MSTINETIRKRKSVYPMQYMDKPVPKEILQELLINANHAPTHRLTEPWRFKVFTENARNRLGEFLSKKYEEITPDSVPSKAEKIRIKPGQCGAVLAIILHRDPTEKIPEWEEIAAVACAVQNIWIALDQYELGGYWSTPSLCQFLGEHVTLKENEKCIGFFYIGYCEPSDRIISKKPIEEKTEWIES